MAEENTSISFADLFQQRDVGQAVKELRECTTGMGDTLQALGMAFPGTTAIGAIVGGQMRGLFALAPSVKGDLVSPVAPDRLRQLARIIGRLNPELRSAFEEELGAVPRTDGPPVNFVTAEEIAADDAGRA